MRDKCGTVLKLSKQRGECSKLIFLNTSVLLLLQTVYTGILWF